MVLEKTLESPSDHKEIQPVHPKRDQSWMFTGGTDAEAETAILWPPDMKSWLIWKDPDSGKDWGQEKRLKGGEEGGDKGWDGGMASPIRWTRVWANSGRWWRIGKPGVLQSMGSQRVRHNLATEQYTGKFTPLPSRRMWILWKLLCQTFYSKKKQVINVAPIRDFSVGCLGMNKKSSIHKQCQQPHPRVMNCGFLIKDMKLTQKMF